MSKRSRKLALSAGMLVAVVSIPPVPLAEALCTASFTCPDGTVISCTGVTCGVNPQLRMVICGRNVEFC